MAPIAAIAATRNHPAIWIFAANLMDWLWEPLEYFGESLVFVGVVGEVLAEHKLILKDDQARRDALEVIASWVLVAGLAISLGALIGTNEHFNGTIANLNNQAATSNERAAKASRDAAELQVKADELEERLLEEGPRNLLLYGKRGENFVNSLRQFKGQKVQVRKCLFNNNEVRDTAERLTVLFNSAGWDVSPHSPDWGESNCMILGPNERIPTGIWIGTPNPQPASETRGRAKELVKFLGQVPLAASLHSVRVETGRASESRTTIQGQYGDPDSIVVTVLGHEEVATEAGIANQLATNTAEEQREAAEAQRITSQVLRWVALGINRRVIDQKRCVERLKGRTVRAAELWYVPDDDEASFFAWQIYRCADGAGWSVSKPNELPAKDVHELKTNSGAVIPLDEARRSAYSEGFAAVTKEISTPGPCSDLFEVAILGSTGAGGMMDSTNPALPDGRCVLIVGPHRANIPLVPPPKKQPTKSTKTDNR